MRCRPDTAVAQASSSMCPLWGDQESLVSSASSWVTGLRFLRSNPNTVRLRASHSPVIPYVCTTGVSGGLWHVAARKLRDAVGMWELRFGSAGRSESSYPTVRDGSSPSRRGTGRPEVVSALASSHAVGGAGNGCLHTSVDSAGVHPCDSAAAESEDPFTLKPLRGSATPRRESGAACLRKRGSSAGDIHDTRGVLRRPTRNALVAAAVAEATAPSRNCVR